MELYNIISCRGFIEANEKLTINFSACAGARLVLVAIFFLNALIRKWGGEEIGMDYNFFSGLIGGVFGYLIPLTILGNIKISFVIGIVAMLIGGYGIGKIFGEGGGNDGFD